MKKRTPKQEKKFYQIDFLFGLITFPVGIMGIFFLDNQPLILRLFINFCFIFGGSSFFVSLLYLFFHRTKEK